MRAVMIAALVLSLVPPAWAGPGAKKLAGVIQSGNRPFTINGNSSIVNGGTEDTGTESITTGSGNITAAATCTDNASVATSVTLYVDGSARSSLTCDGTGESKTGTLSYGVTAGAHNLRIAGSGSEFSANNFRKP